MNPGGHGGSAGSDTEMEALAGQGVDVRDGGAPGAAGTAMGDQGGAGGRGVEGSGGMAGAMSGYGRWTRDGFLPEFGGRGTPGLAGTGGGGGGAGFSTMPTSNGGAGSRGRHTGGSDLPEIRAFEKTIAR